MKKIAWALVLGLGLWFSTSLFSCSTPLAVATFNIRMFPEGPTDHARVAQLIADLDADLIAVQEIRDEDALLEVLRNASAISGRDLRLVLASCGGTGAISTGLIYDRSRLTLLGTKQYREHRADGEGECKKSRMRAALLGVFEDKSGERISALSVHMQHGPNPDQLEARKQQWAGVVQILKDAKKTYGGRTIALGDFNSTGFSDDAGDERSFIFKTTKDAGLSLATENIPCTSYWQPPNANGEYVPSILDHMVVGDGDWSTPEPRGMCEALSCQRQPKDSPPPDYKTVSDHCPLRITVK